MSEFAPGDRVRYCVKNTGYEAYRDAGGVLRATVHSQTKKKYRITLDNKTMCYPDITINVSARYLEREL